MKSKSKSKRTLKGSNSSDIKIIENNGFVFPKSVQRIHYTDILDLKMTTNYKQFKESGFAKHLKKINKYSDKLIIFDMTGNIGCDAVNFAECFKNKFIFTCELSKIKAECLKNNVETFDNIIVFNDNSSNLLKAYFENDINYILDHCLNKSDINFFKNLIGYNVLFNIDPPFGEEYDKDNEYTELVFDGKDIMKYLKDIDNKYGDKIIQYILKAPLNFKISKQHSQDICDEIDKLNEFELNYVNTKKSAFRYILLNSYDLQINFNKSLKGGMLLQNQIKKLKKDCSATKIKNIVDKYKIQNNLNYVDTLNEIEFNKLLTDILAKSENSSTCEIILSRILYGMNYYKLDNKFIQLCPIIINYNISLLFAIHSVMCYSYGFKTGSNELMKILTLFVYNKLEGNDLSNIISYFDDLKIIDIYKKNYAKCESIKEVINIYKSEGSEECKNSKIIDSYLMSSMYFVYPLNELVTNLKIALKVSKI